MVRLLRTLTCPCLGHTPEGPQVTTEAAQSWDAEQDRGHSVHSALPVMSVEYVVGYQAMTSTHTRTCTEWEL